MSAGNYIQSKDDAAGSVTVSFGDLYIKEVRKVIVDLLLPPASSPVGSDVLEITYTYSSGGKLFDANLIILTVSHTGRTSVEPEREEVMMEENRLRTAQMMKEARVMADDQKLGNARDKLFEAQNLLEDVVNDESNPLIEMLKSELQQRVPIIASVSLQEVMIWKSCACLPLCVWTHTLSKTSHLTRIPASHCPLWTRMRSKNSLPIPLLPSLELLATIFRRPFGLSNPLTTYSIKPSARNSMLAIHL